MLTKVCSYSIFVFILANLALTPAYAGKAKKGRAPASNGHGCMDECLDEMKDEVGIEKAREFCSASPKCDKPRINCSSYSGTDTERGQGKQICESKGCAWSSSQKICGEDI